MTMDGQTFSPIIGGVILALLAILVVWAVSHFAVTRLRPPVQEPVQRSFTQVQSHGDAVLIIELGGRIRVINDNAREWFDLREGELPNIEALGRRIRPSESFLELCATEGQ